MKKIYFTSLLLLLAATACRKDFEEINRDPLNPTAVPTEALFNGVLSSLQLGWNEQFYLHNETFYELTQQAALTAHAWPNTEIGTNEAWANFYTALRNIRELERRFDAAADPASMDNVRAMLKIVLAYKAFRISDLFGDIPFFEAGRGVESVELLRPRYDSQEAIYRFLLDELKWAAANLHLDPSETTAAGNPYYRIGAYDTVLDDDLRRWQRWANSLRLRYALRAADRDRDLAAAHVSDILTNNLPLIRRQEEVCLWPRALGMVFDSHHWSFQEHKNMRMGSTMWQLLSPQDEPDGSGIKDPRARIFFEPNNAGEWKAFPNDPGPDPPGEGGIPYNGARDFNWSLKGATCLFSPFNYYLVRDNEDVPEILQTAAEVNFLKAEAYKRGIGVPADDLQAEIEYSEGIAASIGFWFDVVEACQRWTEEKPVRPQLGEIYQFINSPAVSFSQNGRTLELIYAQRWIDAFRQPWEGFALARTGRTPRQGAPLTTFRLTYPASEREYNQANWQEQATRMGGDTKETRVWWMN